ncbi:hypothetical protein [Microbulbifer sp. SAOS-129_SWC]|uniref:hypothetical protein n=1 Tax=Microbulbifer sp. SAOS-129_SWC TaxID=3145235 RepID=UPI0032167F50
MAKPAKQKIRITAPCAAAGETACIGDVLELEAAEANQLIGTGRAVPAPASAKLRKARAEQAADTKPAAAAPAKTESTGRD